MLCGGVVVVCGMLLVFWCSVCCSVLCWCLLRLVFVTVRVFVFVTVGVRVCVFVTVGVRVWVVFGVRVWGVQIGLGLQLGLGVGQPG